MKNLKTFIGLVLVLFTPFVFSACSDDDDMLQFTIDEVVEGDILTGKQLPISGNTINVYATMSYTVNVQNAKGGISAVSDDEDIATVKVVNMTYEAQPIKDNGIVVYGHKTGKTQINVSDSEGHTVALTVNVLDEKDYWTTLNTYTKNSLVEDEIQITGVNDDDASKIRNEILANKSSEAKFVLNASKSYAWHCVNYKMLVYGKSGLLYELPYGVQYDNNFKFHVVDDHGETIKTYTFWYVSSESANFLMEDISDDYNAQYPGVQVVLKMAVEKQ